MSALVAAATFSASKIVAFAASSMKRVSLNKTLPPSACAIALTVAVAVVWKRHKSRTHSARHSPAMRDNLRDSLLGIKGDDIASIDVIEKAGDVFFGGSIDLYGLSPRQFQDVGVCLCNRTVIECTNDRLALHTSEHVRAALLALSIESAVVVDIMCGSGNLMMHLMKTLRAPLCLGFENNSSVADCARVSLAAVLRSTSFRSRCHIIGGDWAEQFPAQWQQRVAEASCLPDDAVVFIVAPPWGDGFCFERGLDLTRTHPPVDLVLQQLIVAMAAADGRGRQMFACVQTHETMVEVRVCMSTAELLRSKLWRGRCVVLSRAHACS
jgi:hypothetical protein